MINNLSELLEVYHRRLIILQLKYVLFGVGAMQGGCQGKSFEGKKNLWGLGESLMLGSCGSPEADAFLVLNRNGGPSKACIFPC